MGVLIEKINYSKWRGKRKKKKKKDIKKTTELMFKFQTAININLNNFEW